MRDGRSPTLWPARLRWRLRGASQWPLFMGLTVADAVLLTVLPVSGRHTGLVPGLLVAMFLNLVAVAGPGRAIGLWLRRRHAGLPKVVAEDRAGSASLAIVSAGLLAAGLLHIPAREAADRAARAQGAAVRAFVGAHGAPANRAHLDQMDVEQESDDLFRTCVPGDPGAGVPPLCVIVQTSTDPPIVHLDADRTPNRHS
jgi:hypothetical protein